MADAADSYVRALIISYVFPPTGGVGVARPLKMAKFLPEFGITPTVLTASNPSVPLRDESLLNDVDPSMQIVRAKTLEPGYGRKEVLWGIAATESKVGFLSKSLDLIKSAVAAIARLALLPDAQILWQPGAALALLARLARRADDVLWITAPPFSAFLLAPLARLRGVAVVLDYRDEWKTVRNSYEMKGPLSNQVGAFLERRLLGCANAITTTTPASRKSLLVDHPFLDPGSVHVITNGYDPDDFPGIRPEPPTDRFVVTYAGTVYALTTPSPLLDAVKLVRHREPDLASNLRVRFIGRVVETEESCFDGTEDIGVERIGYVPKAEIIDELCKSHLNLCMLANHVDCQRIYPAKIFELMYLGRPVMSISPPGELSDLVTRAQLGVLFDPRDVEGIAEELIRRLRQFARGDYQFKVEVQNLDEFHRRTLAARLSEVLRHAALDN